MTKNRYLCFIYGKFEKVFTKSLANNIMVMMKKVV